MKIEGSISQRYGSEDPDLESDPHQNVMDPQHCHGSATSYSIIITNSPVIYSILIPITFFTLF
jgi:hypothetical protein